MPVRRRPPSGSFSTPGSTTRSARCTKAPRRWTGCAGAGARHHHHRRGDDLLLEQAPDQHHRYPGPRRLHGRGGALAARPRRRRRGVRRGRRRRAAVRDGVAPGRPVQGSAHRFRQQDGSRRRRLRSLRLDDAVAPQRQPGRDPDSLGPRGHSPRRHRPRADEGRRSTRTSSKGADYELVDVPAELRDAALEEREQMVEAVAETDDQLLEKYLAGEAISERRAQERAAPRHDRPSVAAGHLRQRLQEQGRPAPARRGGRLPAVAGRHSAGAGSRAGDRAAARAARARRRAFRRPGLQDHERPVRRAARLLPRLFGASRVRHRRAQRDEGPEGAGRPSAARCTPTSARRSTRCWRATSPPRWA